MWQFDVTGFIKMKMKISQYANKSLRCVIWCCVSIKSYNLTTILVVVGVWTKSGLRKLKTYSIYHENPFLQKFCNIITQVLNFFQPLTSWRLSEAISVSMVWRLRDSRVILLRSRHWTTSRSHVTCKGFFSMTTLWFDKFFDLQSFFMMLIKENAHF